MEALGNLFTFEVMIRKNHKLITDGPYAYLMHPSYTGINLFLKDNHSIPIIYTRTVDKYKIFFERKLSVLSLLLVKRN